MVPESDGTLAKRRLMLRDGVSVFLLVLVTILLFVITLFLFRSYTAHRAELAQRWSERGRRALASGKPAEAVADLRTALSYAPGVRDYELLLATALGRSGEADASYSYFQGLWDATPGDGNVNLALARLAAQRQSPAEAIRYYRAAIYGTWQGDGVERRAELRMELARYLIAQHDLEGARLELQMAGGNTADSYDRDLTLGQLFEAAQDAKDAEVYYMKAIAARPHATPALEAAGRLAYGAGDYATAARLFRLAVEERSPEHSAEATNDEEMARNASRLLQLNPAGELTVRERTARIKEIRALAKKRLAACSAQTAAGTASPELQDLAARWKHEDALTDTAHLLHDPALQDAVLRLAYDTESLLESACGPAQGDDALVLRLARKGSPEGVGTSQ